MITDKNNAFRFQYIKKMQKYFRLPEGRVDIGVESS